MPSRASQPPPEGSSGPGPGAPDFHLEGHSLGGIETAVVVPEWRLAIDVGRGRTPTLRCDHLALTHTHMDHAGGIPYLLALRQLLGMKPPRIYAPAPMAEGLAEVIAAWDRVQRYESAFELVPIEAGDRHPLAKGLELVPFRTHHPVPSYGYTIVRVVRKLLPELVGHAGPEIAALRRAGHEVTAAREVPLLSVTGDTLPVALDRAPERVLRSRVLVVECTFLDHNKPKKAVLAGGHVHLDDLLERAEALDAEHLVLSHFSQLYRAKDIPALLRPLAERLAGRLWIFPTAPGEPLVEVQPDPQPSTSDRVRR